MTRDELENLIYERTRCFVDAPVADCIFDLIAAEREACAKVAENTYDRQIVWYPKGYYIDPNSLGDINKAVAEGCAAAIRARGET